MRPGDAAHMETFLKIRTILEKNHADAEREITFYTEIRRMLVEKFTGKRVDTKRTLTYIQSEHPTWVVTWYSMGNSLYLRVWGGDSGFPSHNDYARVCINKCRDLGWFDAVEFDRDNTSVLHMPTAQTRREKLLDDTSYLHYIAKEIDDFNERKDNLVKMIETQVDHYDIQKLANL